MKKAVLIIFGIIILAAAYFAVNKKPKTQTASNNQQQSAISQQSSGPVQVVVNYDSAKPFTAQEYQVSQGQTVDIKVTSDVADELHFHGYDLHTDLTAGKQGVIEFVANNTGRFEFELESRSKTLGVIDVNPK